MPRHAVAADDDDYDDDDDSVPIKAPFTLVAATRFPIATFLDDQRDQREPVFWPSVLFPSSSNERRKENQESSSSSYLSRLYLPCVNVQGGTD